MFSLFKKSFYDWHLIGLLPIVFGILCYFLNVINHMGWWNYFWVCPVTAIITGFAVLLRNRFIMSSSVVWVSSGPLPAVIFYTQRSFELWQLYHIFSVITMLAILYHFREIWNLKGLIFGLTIFYSYIFTTSYLSGGRINMIGQLFKLGDKALYLGIFFAILSVAIILWDKSGQVSSKKS